MTTLSKSDVKTWLFIKSALLRGCAYARALGHVWTGDSCFFATSLALGLVIDTRNRVKLWSRGDGGQTLQVDDPACIELAYADHYLNMRAITGMLGPNATLPAMATSEGYDLKKRIAFGMRDMGNEPFPDFAPSPWDPVSRMPDAMKIVQGVRALFGGLVGGVGQTIIDGMKENPKGTLSRPDRVGVAWAHQGTQDGVSDSFGTTMSAEWEALFRYRAAHQQ